MSSEPALIVPREGKTPGRRSGWRRWPFLIAVLLLISAVAVWTRPTRVRLSDGRLFVIDKVTKGPDHASSSPFTLDGLWTTVTSTWRDWPVSSVHSDNGTIGVFYHSEPIRTDSSDSIYVADRDGWWWKSQRQGPLSEAGKLAVFPPMSLPRSPRFEVWTNGERTGSGVLAVRAMKLPAPRQLVVTPFPFRKERGATLVVVHSVDVKTVDDVRPSEAEVHLRVERFRDGQPVRMKLREVFVRSEPGQGHGRKPDAQGRFRTTLSPHAPYWTIRLSVDQDHPEQSEPEAPIDIKLVINPRSTGTVPAGLKRKAVGQE